MIKSLMILLLCGLSLFCNAQSKQGDKWIDNSLRLEITEDLIREKGVFTYCIIDTSRGFCIENLSTGVEVSIYNAEGRELWKGIGSGRLKRLALAKPFPDASYIIIRAFKPFVTNVSSGNRIHQDKPMELKYMVQ